MEEDLIESIRLITAHLNLLARIVISFRSYNDTIERSIRAYLHRSLWTRMEIRVFLESQKFINTEKQRRGRGGVTAAEIGTIRTRISDIGNQLLMVENDLNEYTRTKNRLILVNIYSKKSSKLLDDYSSLHKKIDS